MADSEDAQRKSPSSAGSGLSGWSYYPKSEQSYGGSSSYSGLSNSDPAYVEWKKAFLNRSRKEFQAKYETPSSSTSEDGRPKMADFEVLRTLGSGAFGRVLLVKYNPKEDELVSKGEQRKYSTLWRKSRSKLARYYAMKVLEKQKVVKQKQVEHAIQEKKVLQSVKFPFLIKLKFAFKDNSNLFMVLEYVEGGEMFSHLSKVGAFSEKQAKFFATQIILAFEYMHNLDLIHRDLKPENVLIDSDGYAKLTDFGFAKRVKGRTWTLCGTPEYIAPEILLNRGYGKSVDWWATGVFIYELTAGHTPFRDKNEMKIYEKVLNVDKVLKFPTHFSSDLTDLLSLMIQMDLTKRFGNLKGGVDDIKEHRWFSDVNWMATYQRNVPAPFKPKVKGSGDSSNFGQHEDVPLLSSETEQYKKMFADF